MPASYRPAVEELAYHLGDLEVVVEAEVPCSPTPPAVVMAEEAVVEVVEAPAPVVPRRRSPERRPLVTLRVTWRRRVHLHKTIIRLGIYSTNEERIRISPDTAVSVQDAAKTSTPG